MQAQIIGIVMTHNKQFHLPLLSYKQHQGRPFQFTCSNSDTVIPFFIAIVHFLLLWLILSTAPLHTPPEMKLRPVPKKRSGHVTRYQSNPYPLYLIIPQDQHGTFFHIISCDQGITALFHDHIYIYVPCMHQLKKIICSTDMYSAHFYSDFNTKCIYHVDLIIACGRCSYLITSETSFYARRKRDEFSTRAVTPQITSISHVSTPPCP